MKTILQELEEALKYQQTIRSFSVCFKKLYSKPLIGRDVFYGGSAEGVKVKYTITILQIYLIYSCLFEHYSKGDNISHLTIAYSEFIQ